MKLGKDLFALSHGVFYHPANDAVLICVVPTDNQIDGFEDFDELVVDVTSSETETWSIMMTYSTKEFFNLAENLRRMKR